MINRIAIHLDAHDAMLHEAVHGVGQQFHRVQIVEDHHRLVHVQFKIALRPGETNRRVIAHHLHRHHRHRFALCGVHFSRHDRGAGLVFRQRQFTKSAARPGSQPANIIRNLHQRSRQSLQRAAGEHDFVMRGKTGKFVGVRAEGKPGEFGDFLGRAQWPVTVGAKINWNIPEFWRAGTADDAKLLRAVSTRGLLEEAEAEIGEYRGGIDTSAEADEVRGKYAVWVLEKKKPGLLTLHLTALDHIEHETGAFSAESIATIERLDGVIGKVRGAAERVAPGRTIVAVVSDHGFANYDQQLNLFVAFREAKLFTVDDKGKTTDWRAMPWETGGSAAIVLKDAQDRATLGEVHELLTKLAA